MNYIIFVFLISLINSIYSSFVTIEPPLFTSILSTNIATTTFNIPLYTNATFVTTGTPLTIQFPSSWSKHNTPNITFGNPFTSTVVVVTVSANSLTFNLDNIANIVNNTIVTFTVSGFITPLLTSTNGATPGKQTVFFTISAPEFTTTTKITTAAWSYDIYYGLADSAVFPGISNNATITNTAATTITNIFLTFSKPSASIITQFDIGSIVYVKVPTHDYVYNTSLTSTLRAISKNFQITSSTSLPSYSSLYFNYSNNAISQVGNYIVYSMTFNATGDLTPFFLEVNNIKSTLNLDDPTPAYFVVEVFGPDGYIRTYSQINGVQLTADCNNGLLGCIRIYPSSANVNNSILYAILLVISSTLLNLVL